MPNPTIVHLLRAGRTPCEMRGNPGEWPPGHAGSATWSDVSCTPCLEERPKFGDADLFGPTRPMAECGHPLDHLGRSKLCRGCQRAKDLQESDALDGRPPLTRGALEDIVALIGYGVRESLEDTFGQQRVGFAVVIFDFGERGSMAYASNGQREDVVRTLRELLQKMETARGG